jgi:hypothetical protein
VVYPLALTWSMLRFYSPNYALVGSDAVTNPYTGDTPINTFLPILCIYKANITKPAFIAPTKTPGGADRGTWSFGYIGLT